MTTTMYGIPNCDTIKKARAFLDEHGVVYRFHDYKKLGAPADELDEWMTRLGWERVLNRKGNIWRGLDPARQAEVVDAASAKALMLEQPSAIKRPVLAHGAELLIGFDAAAWARALT